MQDTLNMIDWLLVMQYVGIVFGSLIAYCILKRILKLRVVVKTNVAHIVQYASGTKVYGIKQDAGNSYYAWPEWLPIWGVSVRQFPESIIQIEVSNYDAYDLKRLPFKVDAVGHFRVADAAVAARRTIDEQQLTEQIRNVMQGAVRKVLANKNLDVIMQERKDLGKEFTEEVDPHIEQWGVVSVRSIEFMDIRDTDNSHVIRNIMSIEESTIEQKSRVAIAENKQIASVKEIEAQREIDMQKQEALQAVGMRKAEQEKAVGIADEKQKQEITQQAAITMEKEMAVKEIEQVRQSEILKKSNIIDAQKDKETRAIRAEADKQVRTINADAEKEATITIAEGNLKQMTLNAEGIEKEGRAKGIAEKAIQEVPVNLQIELQKAISEDEAYQDYLKAIETIRVNGEVGKAQAEAMKSADMKIIANGGDITGGINNLSELLSPKGGMSTAGYLEALANTPVGKSLMDKLLGKGNEAQ